MKFSIQQPEYRAPKPNRITQFAFRTRVTDQLVAVMELAAMHNPNDPEQVQLAKALRRAQMARAFSAQWLDLDSTELRSGFTEVTQEDFDRIFLGPVTEDERP